MKSKAKKMLIIAYIDQQNEIAYTRRKNYRKPTNTLKLTNCHWTTTGPKEKKRKKSKTSKYSMKMNLQHIQSYGNSICPL